MFHLLSAHHQTKKQACAIQKWSETKGTLIQAHPYEGRIKDLHSNKTHFREPYWLYEYMVNGKRYENTTLDALPIVQTLYDRIITLGHNAARNNPRVPEDEADQLLWRFKREAKTGDAVTIYYNSENPAQSSLVRHSKLPSRNWNVVISLTVIGALLSIWLML